MKLGKYQREAMERERRELIYKRKYGHGGLSVPDGCRLDELNEMLGDDPLADDARTGSRQEEA
jgi:hypothetical protein